MHHRDWPIDKILWSSAPSSFGEQDSLSGLLAQDAASMMSWSSSNSGGSCRRMAQPLGTKVEMVYSLLSMLGANDKEDMSKTLLAMSQSPESCIAMRQSGCLPLLVQLLHGPEPVVGASGEEKLQDGTASEARRRASQALHNIVHAQADDKRGRRETRVLRLLEQIREYSDKLQESKQDMSTSGHDSESSSDINAGPAMAAIMKLSFDEEHRNAMCHLGGLHAIAELIEMDEMVNGNTSDQFCVTLRRYAGMALTNLTFGDGNNKALLCSLKPFMHALVEQLHSPSEDLRQVMASVLRNLSWRADCHSKQLLREMGAVGALMAAATEAHKDSTLKSVLSALWNLSAHCSANKADICCYPGSLGFLVQTLNHSNSAIIENGGGILRNISSHIAVHEEYRGILRRHNCLQILLQHLKSSSLTVVSNACGTLWNLSARCVEDQQALWDMGAVGMLRNLVHSKHKMISMGSSAALKNLLSASPYGIHPREPLFHKSNNNKITNNMPSLMARKQKALEEELDQTLAETCDNIESPKTSPTHPVDVDNRFSTHSNGNISPYYCYLPGRMYHSVNGQISNYCCFPRSESHESVGSTHSEPAHSHQRTIYHSFSRNYRYISLNQRYSGYPDFDQGSFINRNHDDRLHNSTYNERYMSSSGMGRRSEFLPKEPDRSTLLTNQRKTDNLLFDKGLVPAHCTMNVHNNSFQQVTNKLEEVSLEDQSEENQQLDYNSKFIEDDKLLAEKTAKETVGKVRGMTKNGQKGESSVKHYTWQPQNNHASLHSFTHKRTKICGLQQPTDLRQKDKFMDTAEDNAAPYSLSEEPTAFYNDPLPEGSSLNSRTSPSLRDLMITPLAATNSESSEPGLNITASGVFEGMSATKTSQFKPRYSDMNKDVHLLRAREHENKNSFPGIKGTLLDKKVTSAFGTSVPFAEEVNCAMQMPLVVSGSFDEPSIHEDCGTAVNNYSCHTDEVGALRVCPDSSSRTAVSRTLHGCHTDEVVALRVLPDTSSRTPVSRTFALSSSPTYKSPENYPKALNGRQEVEDKDDVKPFTDESEHILGTDDRSKVPNEAVFKTCSSPIYEEKDDIFLKNNLDVRQGFNYSDNTICKEDVVGACSTEGRSEDSSYSQKTVVESATSLIPGWRGGFLDQVNKHQVQGTLRVLSQTASLSTSRTSQIETDSLSHCDNENNLQTEITSSMERCPFTEKRLCSSDSLCSDNEKVLQQCTWAAMSFPKMPFGGSERNNEYTSQQYIQANQSQSKIKCMFTPQSASSMCSDGDNVIQQCIQTGVSSPSKIPKAFSRYLQDQPMTSSQHLKENAAFQINATEPKNNNYSNPGCGFSHGWPKVPKDYSNISVRPKPLEQSKTKLEEAIQLEPGSSIHSFPLDTYESSENDGVIVVIPDLNCHEEGVVSSQTKGKASENGREVYASSYERNQLLSDIATKLSTATDRSTVNDVTSHEESKLSNANSSYLCTHSQSSLSLDSMDELSSCEPSLLDESNNFGRSKCKSKIRSSHGISRIERNRKVFGKCGIPVYCGPWTGSQECVKGTSNVQFSVPHFEIQTPNEDHEEKGKEDERSRENMRKGESVSSWSGSEDFSNEKRIPETLQTVEREENEYDNEMLLVVTIGSAHTAPDVTLVSNEIMSQSLELLEEAHRVAEKVEAAADDLTHSSVSCLSDLENAKAPSLMGDIMSLSMTSSNGISEFEKGATWKRTKDGRRVVVPETVRRALAGNFDNVDTGSSCINTNMVRSASCIGSLENLSMKSSLTFELLENINPPSGMELIPRSGSCTSLNSISSDILESKSQSLGSPNIKTSGGSSEMYERLNAAAAMVQVYSRELSTIMNGGNGNGNKSSSTSENVLDHIQPPSVLMDIAEVTVHDGIDVITDNMASDTEIEEELPRDDETEAASSDTLRATYLLSFAKDDCIDGSSENVSTLMEDEPLYSPRKKFNHCKLDITAEELCTIQKDANILVSALHHMGKHGDKTNTCDSVERLLDDETLSLISNESEEFSDKNSATSPIMAIRGPRIVKPINRNTIKQLREKTVKAVSLKSTQIVKNKFSVLVSPLEEPKTKIVRSGVPRLPNVCKKAPSSSSTVSSKVTNCSPRDPLRANKTSGKFNSDTYTRSKSKSNVTSERNRSSPTPPCIDDSRPKLIKQRTFTKESQNACSPGFETTPIASSSIMTFDRRMSYSAVSPSNSQTGSSQMKRNLSGANLKKDVVSNGMKSSSSSRSLTRHDDTGRISVGETSKCSPSTSNLGNHCEPSLTASNISLSSTSSVGTGAIRKCIKKDVSSKIACIWKKGNSKHSYSSPEQSDYWSGMKTVGIPSERSKVVKPVTPTSGRYKMSALGRKHASS